jgi:hypothetical protein
MNEMDFETQIHALARRMDYPRTPDVAGHLITRLQHVTKPRFPFKAAAWALITILILFSSLFLIPPARAAILQFIQIGIVRIFPPEATSTPAPTKAIPATALPMTAIPSQTSESLIPLLTRMLGRTSLEDAIRRVTFPILLPTYPSDLGEPDYVFVQEADGEMAILVWLEPNDPQRVRLSLHFIPSGSWVVRKYDPPVIQETSINEQRAIWAEGPYPLILSNGNVEFTRLIEGHVLIWTDGEVTYRLETNLSLEEAVKMAESLAPIP